MDKVIWKFPINENVRMPLGADIIKVGEQRGEPLLWACISERTVGEEQPLESRSFKIYGTGHKIPMRAKWVGSFTMRNNNVYLEWHVFETTGIDHVPLVEPILTTP